jgi:hypothetical protein
MLLPPRYLPLCRAMLKVFVFVRHPNLGASRNISRLLPRGGGVTARGATGPF